MEGLETDGGNRETILFQKTLLDENKEERVFFYFRRVSTHLRWMTGRREGTNKNNSRAMKETICNGVEGKVQ